MTGQLTHALDHVPLIEATDEARFGGKAAHLGAALRAGLPVPGGVALSVEAADAIATDADGARAAVEALFAAAIGSPCAARSSAVGEDGAGASFAGQHVTVLNVRHARDVPEAVVKVWRSARSDGAMAYRRRLGLAREPRIGVVLQRLVDAECAGVLFTRDPITGADERVIEAAWGLGEAVVSGLVTPDRYRIDRSGHVLERVAGDKDRAIFPDPAASIAREVEVSPERARALCLDASRLARLHDLASRCEAAFPGGGHDLEWAFATSGELFLLQRRAITASWGRA